MKQKFFNLRRLSQIATIGIIFYLAYAHQKYGIEKAASIDAYCPFGAIEGFLTYVFTGEFLKRLYFSSFILGALVFIMTLFLGRIFCSYLCPLGAVQEWLRSLGRKIGNKKDYELPRKIDYYARYLKYIILVILFYYSYKVSDLVFRDYDPFNAMTHMGEEFDEKIIGYFILFGILFFSLFTRNWWCRYFCPLGAIMGIVKKVNIFSIKRNEETCVSCSICNQACPSKLEIKDVKAVKSADCTSCLKCVSDCPKNSLRPAIFNQVMDYKTYIIIVLLAFFVPFLIVINSPWWKTMTPSNLIDGQGNFDVNNIRGSNTLENLLKTSFVPFEFFRQELNLPEDTDKHLKLKEIGPAYNLKNEAGDLIETEDFRGVIIKYREMKEKL